MGRKKKASLPKVQAEEISESQGEHSHSIDRVYAAEDLADMCAESLGGSVTAWLAWLQRGPSEGKTSQAITCPRCAGRFEVTPEDLEGRSDEAAAEDDYIDDEEE